MLRSLDNKIFYREWECADPAAAILLVHGLGGYSGRFFELGPFLAKNSIKPYAIELMGFGEHPSTKGHIENFKLYTADLKYMVEFIKSRHPGKKVFIFGESMGGLVTLDFAIHHQDLIDALLIMSPAIKDKLPMDLKGRIFVFLNAIFNPFKYYDAKFGAGIFTRDLQMIKRIDGDPLEVRELTAKFFLSILKSLIYVNMNPGKISVPLLMLLAGKDQMVSAEAAEGYFRKISSKDKQLKWYPEMFHALYVDKDRGKVFGDIIGWIKKHL